MIKEEEKPMPDTEHSAHIREVLNIETKKKRGAKSAGGHK